VSIVKAGILISLVLMAACASGADERSESRATVWRPVASWSGGAGSTTLETFPIAAGRLRVYWETRAQPTAGEEARFQVTLHSADSGRVLEEVVDTRTIGAAMRELVDDHQRFYFSVDASGVAWTLRVEEGLASRR
jgi:glucan biosynthesis protein